MPADVAETVYERNQRFNRLTAWLHGVRYRHILQVFERLARDCDGRAIRVAEIGCAHAKLFALLNERFDIEYTGIEIDPDSVAMARARHGQHANFTVVQQAAESALEHMQGRDIVVALETLEHIPEGTVVRIAEAIAAARPTLFVCSVPVEIGPALWLKNLGSLATGYIRHREYTWRETFWAGLYNLDKLPPHGVGHKGFDWRWLAQTIRQNLRIVERRHFPFDLLPAALAFSVFFIAEGRSAAS